MAYLWHWFQELDAQRSVGQGGPGPITYSDLRCWADLTDRRPRPYEVDALMKLDIVMRLAMLERPDRR